METFQDSASALYRNSITPLLHKCASYIAQPTLLNPDNSFPFKYSTVPSAMDSSTSSSIATSRSLQHAESLKWQQEVFHRLLHLICLEREGLATQIQVEGCKAQILAFLQSTHPDGEWPEFTRDKLLFLQDLLFAACITEKEYHDAKKPLILRLADQGATIDIQDFIFDTRIDPSTANTDSEKPVTSTKGMARKKSKSKPEMSDSCTAVLSEKEVNGSSSTVKPTTSSPLKHVMGAMSRISKSPSKAKLALSPLKMAEDHAPSSSSSCSPQVPHPFDSLRPEHCPERDPPSPYQLIYHPKQPDLMTSKGLESNKDGIVPDKELERDGADNVDASSNCEISIVSPRHSSAIRDGTDSFTECTSPIDKGSANNKPSSNTPSRFKSFVNGFIQKKALHSESGKITGYELDEEERDEDREKLLSHTDVKSGSSRWGITGLIQKRNVVVSDVTKSSNPHASIGNDLEENVQKPLGKGKWGLDMFRLPKKLQFDPPIHENVVENEIEKPCLDNMDESSVTVIPVNGRIGKEPNTRELKKKTRSSSAPAASDFIIDKVLGENIKNELSRIRAEMNKTQPGQMFTNEQIDAIAARLPMDTSELKKFFPQTWCERYGDVVLEVVQKEFKEHVTDMQKLGRPMKEKRVAALSPMKAQNDENMVDHNNDTSKQHRVPAAGAPRAPDFNKCFSALDENTHTTIPSPTVRKQKQQQHSPSPIKEKLGGSKLIGRIKRDLDQAKHGDENLEFNVEEEILKKPLQRFNEYGSYLRA